MKRSPFDSSSWSEFFDEVEADLQFNFRGAATNLTEMLHLVTESKDAEERAEGMKCVNDGLGGPFAKYSAQTFYMVVGLKAVEDKERGYANPMDARNKSNRIPDSVVDVLHNAVTTLGGSLTRRYYKLKARHLGLPVLRWSDRNAPMPFADTTVIPFDEAADIVTTSYESFSPTLTTIVKSFFTDRRIDAPVVKEKRHGAFNSSHVLPGGKPVSYTLLNYLGSNKDVMTLAHELGHGVHGILAGEAQGPLMFHAPIAYCETASVFGEMTTFSYLKDRLTQAGDKLSLLALIMSKIDATINTVVRQIGFSNFERRLHGMNESYKTGGSRKRSVEELDAIWLDLLVLRLMNEGGAGARKTWFVLDELATLQKLPQLSAAINENRHSNCPMVLGFQGKAQVEALYGHVAENMLSQPATKIFFKTSEPYASEWISKSIGEIEVERFRESRTRGAFPHQRENEQREITREPLVMASEIGGLEPLHGYLKHGNYVLRLRIPYLTLNEPAEKFIERKMTTPATAMPATTPAKEPEPAQAITPAAPPPRKPVRAIQVEQGQEQRPAAVNEQSPFFE